MRFLRSHLLRVLHVQPRGRMPTVNKYGSGTVIAISDLEMTSGPQEMIVRAAIELAARDIADRIVSTHGDAILAKVSPEALATLAQATATAEVARAIREGVTELKRPVRIVEVDRRRRFW